MNTIQLILMLLSFLRALHSSRSLDELQACESVQQIGGDGKLIEWIWENREEILEFVLRLIGMFGGSSSDDSIPSVQTMSQSLIED